jgi:DNA-binding NtrC family response regulator
METVLPDAWNQLMAVIAPLVAGILESTPRLYAAPTGRANAGTPPARRDTVRDLCARAVIEVPSASIDVELDAPPTAPAEQRVAALALLDVPVLFRGETGRATARMARRLHAASSRARGALFEVHLQLLSEHLVEPAIFGVQPGCLCDGGGATGVVERADGGTVVLCDVDELTPPVQAKLLHVLTTGQYRRIGERHPRQADVRIVATTTRDLAMLVGGRFRADLREILAAHEVVLP